MYMLCNIEWEFKCHKPGLSVLGRCFCLFVFQFRKLSVPETFSIINQVISL